jgi:hypothetical protein
MLTIALILTALFQETVDNPEYKGWSSFKPGSSVTYKFTKNGAPQEGSQKVSLKSITETEAVLEAEILKDGAVVGKPFERNVPAKVPAAAAGKLLKSGEEEIEVGGKKLTCMWKEMERTLAGGKTATSKIWISSVIPGMAARIDIAGGVMTASEWEKK